MKNIFQEKHRKFAVDSCNTKGNLDIDQPLFSSAAGTLVHSDYLTSNPEESSLTQSGQLIHDVLREFKEDHEEYYNIFHETYTNNHYRYHHLLGDDSYPNRKGATNKITLQERVAFEIYKEIFNEEIRNSKRKLERINNEAVYRNCFVSFSQAPEHALKYASGRKDMAGKILTPGYNKQGVPKYKYLGKVYLALLKEEDFNAENPTSVLDLHAQGKITISAIQRNILSEAEVSFLGYLKGKYIVYSQVVKVPSFNKKYKKAYKNKYGLNKNNFDIFKGTLGSDSNGESLKSLLEDYIFPVFSKKLHQIAIQKIRENGGKLTYIGLGQEINSILPFQLSHHLHKVHKNMPIFISPGSSTCIGKLGSLRSTTILSRIKLVIEAVPSSRVERVDIRDYRLTGAASIFSMLLKNTHTLKELILNNLSLTASDAESIAESLKLNQSLSYLSLQDNSIKDEGCAHLCNALVLNSTLTRLNIMGTNSTIKTLREFLRILEFDKNRKKPQYNTGLIELFHSPAEEAGSWTKEKEDVEAKKKSEECIKKILNKIRSGLRRNAENRSLKTEDAFVPTENQAPSLQHEWFESAYEEHEDNEIDFKEAVIASTKAASQGHSEAAFETICLLIDNLNNRTNRIHIKRCMNEYFGNISFDAEIEDFVLHLIKTANNNQFLETLCNRGNLYFSGNENIIKNYYKAYLYFLCAGNEGYAEAQYKLGEICASSKVFEEVDNEKAVGWYLKAAEQGYALAQATLGKMYEKGRGVHKNSATAFGWYLKAAKREHKDAQYKVGRSYETGQGVPPLSYNCHECFYNPAEHEHKNPQSARDDATAFGWYLKAARQGHKNAQYKVGEMYKKGLGVEPDLLEAAKWYLKAAKREHAKSQCELTKMQECDYLNNLGVSPLLEKLYARAYIEGIYDKNYEFEVGKINEYGGGGHGSNIQAAFFWYSSAAEHGHRDAQYKLWIMYKNGRGVEKDISKSNEWCRKAYTQGFGDIEKGFSQISEFFHAKIKALLRKSGNEG